MRRKFQVLAIILLLFSATISFIPRVWATVGKRWVLIICGSAGGSFTGDAQYMYHVVHDHYAFAGINYLDVDINHLGVNGLATLQNVRDAITVWLHNNAGPNDIVLIYFTSHGTGYNKNDGLELGRIETGGDEQNEVLESALRLRIVMPSENLLQLNVPIDFDGDHINDRLRDFDNDGVIEIDLNDDGQYSQEGSIWLNDIDMDGHEDDLYCDLDHDDLCNVILDADSNGDGQIDNPLTSCGEDLNNDGIIVGVDCNRNGNQNDWVGIDEGCWVGNEIYWDDQLAADLNTVSCMTIFIRQGCLASNISCFGGGLIDDISAPNRVIMTSSNETWYSHGQPGEISFWSKPFIDALHGEVAHWNGNQIVHDGTAVNADLDNNGYVSLYEEWQYAWINDPFRTSGDETPWLDDNGNGLPTYRDGADQFDASDGNLAAQIILEPNLVTVLRRLGYTNIEQSTVDTFAPSHYSITLYAEFASYHASNTLSWYPVGTSNYNLIFSGSEGRFGYLNPPITKALTINSQFGLSFCSPEARYYTETSRNPDQLKHAQVYKNLDNPKMYLIGFENGLGTNDGDYNDMVVSLLDVNSPPTVPSLTGPSVGYVYTTYQCTARSNDIDGDNIYYHLNWGDSNSVVGPAQSNVDTPATHSWTTLGQHSVVATAEDVYGSSTGQSSSPLSVTIGQNDDGTHADAGNSFSTATQYNGGNTIGALYKSLSDTDDYYKLEVPAEWEIDARMTPNSQANFDLLLYRPSGSLAASSKNSGAGQAEHIWTVSDVSQGYWRVQINGTLDPPYSEGNYTFQIFISGGMGGCPYVYTWNGSSYVKDNNILPASEAGNGTDTDDYYKLERQLVPFARGPQQSLYRLVIGEFENEHDYIDQVRLTSIDHDQNLNIAVTGDGEILTYQQPNSPLTCIDDSSADRLSEINSMNGNVSDLGTYFQGYEGDWLLLNFGSITATKANLILRDDMKCMDVCINVQVPDGNGTWQIVDVLHPRSFWSMEAVNMSEYIPSNGNFTIRLYWTAPHRLDYVGLDTSAQASITVSSAAATLAVHSTQGIVTADLLYDDENMVELINGQRVVLVFALPNSPQGSNRDFIFYTNGYYYVLTP